MLRMSGEQIHLQVPPESTAGLRRRSGSEFQTVGPATEDAQVSNVQQIHGTDS